MFPADFPLNQSIDICVSALDLVAPNFSGSTYCPNPGRILTDKKIRPQDVGTGVCPP